MARGSVGQFCPNNLAKMLSVVLVPATADVGRYFFEIVKIQRKCAAVVVVVQPTLPHQIRFFDSLIAHHHVG